MRGLRPQPPAKGLSPLETQKDMCQPCAKGAALWKPDTVISLISLKGADYEKIFVLCS